MAVPTRKTLEFRPQATAFQLDDLLTLVLRGKVRVPHFQRGMRWDESDRIDFLDSIHLGYPVGTLLLWKRAAPASIVKLGRLEIAAAATSDAYWVVDGQQRLTTLVDALLVPAPEGERAAYFDLAEEEFLFLRRTSSDAPLLPLGAALDSKNLIRWLIKNDVASELQDRAIEVGKRLREYRLPAYVVEANDATVVRKIFDRTNRTGKRLSDVEVFDALFGALEEGHNDPLDVLEQSAVEQGFGAIDRNTLLLALRAVGGLPLDRDFTASLEARKGELDVLVASTRRAVASTIEFLRVDARIPHVSLLPYTLPLPVLARFFSCFPEPHTRSRRLLRRWLWRGVHGLALAGSSVGLRTHVEAVVSSDEAAAVKGLLALAPRHQRPEVTDVSNFRFDTARTKAQLCALASLTPRDLRTGLALPFRSTGRIPIVDLVPKQSTGLESRFLHEDIGSSAFTSLLVSCESDAVRESHGVSLEALVALRGGRLNAFLTLRASELSELSNRFVAALAEHGHEDSPALDLLLSA
jgi:hypothetical protein